MPHYYLDRTVAEFSASSLVRQRELKDKVQVSISGKTYHVHANAFATCLIVQTNTFLVSGRLIVFLTYAVCINIQVQCLYIYILFYLSLPYRNSCDQHPTSWFKSRRDDKKGWVQRRFHASNIKWILLSLKIQ